MKISFFCPLLFRRLTKKFNKKEMGNCQSLFLKDKILYLDRLHTNDLFLNSGINKECIKWRYKGTYLGMRAFTKFPGERLEQQQTGKWWICLF